jgi:GNAT superfamily N-acetyltransferase
MAIEIRPFEGDIEALRAFAMSGWLAAYKGKGIVPEWTIDYFHWQMPELLAGRFEEVVAVYDGERLVGVLPSEKVPVRLMGQDMMSTMGGWLTVDPDYVRKGVGRAIVEGMRRFNAEIDAKFMGGFVNTGSLVGRGRQFWTGTSDTRVFAHPRMWARVLDARAVAAGMWSGFDVFACYLGRVAAAPFPIGKPSEAIRPYAPSDIDACHTVFCRHMEHYDLAYRWDRERLAHHLGFGDPARTLVLDRDGKVAGFVNFHVLDAIGRMRLRMGIIDTLAPYDLAGAQARTLLRAALAAMRADGVGLAIILGPPSNRASVLLAGGFMPMFSFYKFIGIKMPGCPSLDPVRRVYAHFR